MIVVIARAAEDDLERIGDTIADFDANRAVKIVRDLRLACYSLDEMAFRHPLLQRREASGVRRFVFGGYLIFYTVEQEVVQILRVMHGAMDYEAILFPTD